MVGGGGLVRAFHLSAITHHLSTITHHPDAQCVVEVLCIVRVDGEGDDVAEVLSASYFLCRDGGIELVGGLLHVLRVFVGQSILREDGVHLGVVVAHLAEHVHHFAHDVLRVFRRPLCDLHHRLLVVLSPFQLFLGDENVVHEEISVGNEEGEVAFHLQSSHHLVVCPLQNLGHHGLFDVVFAPCHHGDLHAVAVESEHRVALSHEHRLVGSVGQERVLAVGLADERSLEHLSLCVQPILVVGNLLQIVVPGHLLEQVYGEHLGRMRGQVQLPENLLVAVCLIGILLKHGLQHLAQLPFRKAFHASLVLSFCHDLYLFDEKFL